jgi:hypothetical protein
MRPIQWWRPLLGGSLGLPDVGRAVIRAWAAWRGESRVWLVPELPAPGRWRPASAPPGWWELAVPAQRPDRVDVFHIGVNGWGGGPQAEVDFPAGHVDGLLERWLNALIQDGVTFMNAPHALIMDLPVITGEDGRYAAVMYRLQPGPTIPLASGERDPHDLRGHWPPEGWPAPSVFPDAESQELYGPWDRLAETELPVAVSHRDPGRRAWHHLLRWPEPLTALMSWGSAMDDLAGQAHMAAIARRSEDDPEGALREAREAARLYVTEGDAPLEWAWFWPTLRQRGVEGLLLEAIGRFRLTAGDLAEACRSEAWRGVMQQKVPVRRAWGALGLFWALLLDRLETYQPLPRCQWCGWYLRGKRGKENCGPQDNKLCFHARRAKDQRRSRISSKARRPSA